MTDMAYTAAVITVSDKGDRGEREDTSGPNLCAILREQGYEVCYTALVPYEPDLIQAELIKCEDQLGIAQMLTTGRTGGPPQAQPDREPARQQNGLGREPAGGHRPHRTRAGNAPGPGKRRLRGKVSRCKAAREETLRRYGSAPPGKRNSKRLLQNESFAAASACERTSQSLPCVRGGGKNL